MTSGASVRNHGFGVHSFRTLLRSRFEVAEPRAISYDLAGLTVPWLEEPPDATIAWVYGLYAVILRRVPEPSGLSSRVERMRSGASAHDIAQSLLASDEARTLGMRDEPDLNVAFVAGAYLTALGRYPDADGRDTHVRLLIDGTTEDELISSLRSSKEATEAARFPPPPIAREVAVAEALQHVVLNRAPSAALTNDLANLYRSGVSPVQIARILLRRERRPASLLRSAFVSPALGNLIELYALQRVALTEARTQLEWQWRVDRKTWSRQEQLANRQEALQIELAQRLAALDPKRAGERA